ncbi:ZIP family metal transporter [Gemmatimonadota bacterium]
MPTLVWIIAGGVLMSAIALVGSLTLILKEDTLHKIVLPLVAFAAGCLLGGAFLHMLPETVHETDSEIAPFLWVLAGFLTFYALEQFLHWHHCHRDSAECSKKPLGYLILIGDGLHNLIGGLAVAAAFVMDIRLGIAAWLAAAAHEVPQEMGDFAVLLHSGWSKGKALLLNVISASTFLAGGLIAYAVSSRLEIWFLVPYAAGNFIYIGASDLVPEVNKQRDFKTSLMHFVAFSAGLTLMYVVKLFFGHSH